MFTKVNAFYLFRKLANGGHQMLGEFLFIANLVMGEGCVWERNGEIDSFHLVFLVKQCRLPLSLQNGGKEVAEQKIRDVQNGWI